MAWVILVAAGLLEVVWAFALKQSHGFTRPVPSAIFFVTAIASRWLLSLSMRVLPLGTAYVIWTGIGAVGAFAVGIIALNEQASALRVLAAGLIVAGLILMKLVTPEG